jgi:hypothetical protein
MNETPENKNPEHQGFGKQPGLDSVAAFDPSPPSSSSNDLELHTYDEEVTERGEKASQDATEPAEEQEGGEYPSGLRLLYLFLALILCMLLAVIDMTITATAVPHITDEFHSLDDIGWYASVFFMTVASSQSTWGKVYRYFDLKTMFLGSIALFELGNLICGMYMLCLSRLGLRVHC